jgi:mono/diheme cytochrome c family protein
MPSFQGQLTEEQIIDLTAYIKSLQNELPPPTGAVTAPPSGKK